MDIPVPAARHFQFILLGIWPVNLLTLWAQGHTWSWIETPGAVMGMWEWGAFVALSLAILAELGGKMFFALAEYRRKLEQAREEGRAEGRKEAQKEALTKARQETRREASDMLTVLNTAARNNPDLLPSLLQEYQEKYQNGSAAA